MRSTILPTSLRHFALFLIALLPCAGVARSMPWQGKTYEQKLDSVKEFERFFRKFKEVAQQVESILALETDDCPEAVDVLLPLLKHKEVAIKEAAKRVLSGYREKSSFEAVLAALVDMKDREMRGELIDVFSQAKQASLLKTIDEIYEKDKGLNVIEKFHIARALGRLGAAGREKILAAFLEDGAYEVRVATLDAIRATKVKELGPKIVPMLADKVWQVQAAAIRALGVLRTMEAVEPLIDFLDDEGRLKQDAASALFEITTRDFGTDHEQWKKQWKFLTSIPNFRLPTDEELETARKAKAEADKAYAPGPNAKVFAGIPTESTRVVFVIDCSASMDDLVTDRKKFKDGGYPSFRKIDIVKTELYNTVNSLDNTTWFNILSFGKKVDRWKPWLTQCTISNKAAALSYIKRLQPLGVASSGGFGAVAGDDSGKTNTYEALMQAFDLDPAKGLVLTGSGDKKPPKLDTIYFLTDGRPSIGKFVDTEDILKEVKKVNELRSVVIHAISIGEFEASFMKRLAEMNGGVFVDLGG
ncbi:MAG TPA: HEAT repeat domain-containing protein [Planctomycetota bacterium]|nr:HEAT repeat domain-containing protein [Planctomycetota bacterium]